jgi:hypothetical protein
MSYPPDDNGKMGLTDKEVEWLRRNRGSNKTATHLVDLYQMIIVCPSDLGARAIFCAARDHWRKNIEDGKEPPL